LVKLRLGFINVTRFNLKRRKIEINNSKNIANDKIRRIDKISLGISRKINYKKKVGDKDNKNIKKNFKQ
jgi:hypothetical protein